MVGAEGLFSQGFVMHSLFRLIYPGSQSSVADRYDEVREIGFR